MTGRLDVVGAVLGALIGYALATPDGVGVGVGALVGYFAGQSLGSVRRVLSY